MGLWVCGRVRCAGRRCVALGCVADGCETGGQWKQEAGASVWSVLRREAARGGLLVGIQERTGEEGSPEAVSEMFHRISCQCSSALE